MRPRKRILLVDSNEERTSIRRFLLETVGHFAVFSAASAEEAHVLAASFAPDLVIACWPLAGADLGKLLSDLHESNPDMRSMLLAETLAVEPEGVVADAVLLKMGCTPAEIIERAKLLCARKRGPKKTVQMIDRMMDLAVRRTA